MAATGDEAGRYLETQRRSNAEILELMPQHRRTSSEEYVASLLRPSPRFDDLQPARTRDSPPAAAAASSSAAAASSGSSESPMVVDDDDNNYDNAEVEDESAFQRALQQSFNEQYLPAAAPAVVGHSAADAAAAAPSSSSAAAAAADSDEDEDIDPDGPVVWSNVVDVSEERRSRLSCVVGMCSNVPLNGPHMHHKCRHYLCAPCMLGLTRSAHSASAVKCPGCRQTIASSEPSEVRNDAMADLKARCIYHRSGCKVVITLENGGKHELVHRQRCNFRPMPCKFCKAEFAAKKLGEHQAQCPQRKVSCGLCSKEMAASDLPSHRKSPLGPDYCQSHNFCPNRCFAKDCKVQPTAEVLEQLQTVRDSDLRAPKALAHILARFQNPTVEVAYEKPAGSSGAAAAKKTPQPRLAVIEASRLSSHLAEICPCRLVDCSFPGCTDSIPHSHGARSAVAAAPAPNPKKRKFVAHELPAHLDPDNKKAKDAHMLAMAERIRELTELLTKAPRGRRLIQSYNLCIMESRLVNYDSNLSELVSNVDNKHFVSGSVKVSGIHMVSGLLTVKFSTPRVGMPTAFEAVVTLSGRRPLAAAHRDEFVMDARRSCDVSLDDNLSLWRAQVMRNNINALAGPAFTLINIKVELFQ
jgi:hypothetical protein